MKKKADTFTIVLIFLALLALAVMFACSKEIL